MKCAYPIAFLLTLIKSIHGLDASLTAGFTGTNQATGNIFTIKAKTQPVSIKSFDINLSGPPAPSPAPIEIWFLPGIDPGYFDPQGHPYTMIFQQDIAGQGKGNVTPLPDLASPVVIPAGATYSFYISVANQWFGTTMWYDVGNQVGAIVASDDNLEIGEGYAMGYPFLGYSDERRWNGNVHYSLGSAGPPSVITSSPTKTPTQAPVTPSPTTSKPTSSPSVSPSRTPTKSPTHTPVTQPPSSKPTVQPATSKPTLSPTKSPVPAPPSPPSSNGNGSDNGEPSPTSPSPTTAKPTSNSNPTPPTDSNTPSPSFRPTLSHEPSSLGPTVWKDNYLPKQPSSSFKMDIDFGKLGIYSAMIIAVISYLSF